MGTGEFCAACGRTGLELVDGICAECTMDRTVLVRAPQRVNIVLCPTCGARQVGSHWERAGTSPLLTGVDLTPALELHPEVGVRTVRWEETGSSALLHQYIGRVSLRFRGIEREVAVPLTAKVDHRTCPECSRKSGHYYTAQLQLRGTLDGPREKTAALRARLDAQWDNLMTEARADWREAISWREALPEGWDYYLVNTMAARSLARLAQRRLGAEMKESATLYGRKDGQDLYRVTICVRVPPPRRPTGPARP